MGACGVGGTFKAYDWKEGIRRVQAEAEYEHGSDYYNGAANNVEFSYAGDKSNLTKTQLNKFRKEIQEECYKRGGYVYKIGIEGYRIITTKFIEKNRNEGGLSWVMNKNQEKIWFMQYKRPCILVTTDKNGNGYCIGAGTIGELKVKAHELLRQCYYSKDFYIVRKNKDTYIDCRGLYKGQKTTSRRTDDKTLVLEVGKYEYFGVAPE